MNNPQFWIYLLIMAGSTFLIRAVPFAAMRKKITNRFIRSFLYYIPYTVLSAMTFPAALYATGNPVSAGAGLLIAIVLAILGRGLTTVAAASCLTVFIAETVLNLL